MSVMPAHGRQKHENSKNQPMLQSKTLTPRPSHKGYNKMVSKKLHTQCVYMHNCVNSQERPSEGKRPQRQGGCTLVYLLSNTYYPQCTHK